MLRNKRSDYSEVLDDDRNEVSLRPSRFRQEQTLEAEIHPGDTLISVALRFNCTVQDIKRLNKIHTDREIFAFKVLKVPLTAENILLDTLPRVHKSGQSSPNNKEKVSANPKETLSRPTLEEKLLVASVSSAIIKTSEDAADQPANSIETSLEDVTDPLLDRSQFRGYPKTFGAPKNDLLTCNSDFEPNWIALLFCILALCVIVPLIYVYVAYEHPEEFSHHSRFDDPDLKYQNHLTDKHNVTTTQRIS